MEITFEFACRDDCLGKMVPSDLRQVVAERDRLKGAQRGAGEGCAGCGGKAQRIFTRDHEHYGPQNL